MASDNFDYIVVDTAPGLDEARLVQHGEVLGRRLLGHVDAGRDLTGWPWSRLGHLVA